MSNTTIARPETIQSHAHGNEAGGLSGKPLMEPSTKVLHDLYKLTGGKITLICTAWATGSMERMLTRRFAPARRWYSSTPRSRCKAHSRFPESSASSRRLRPCTPFKSSPAA